MLSSQPVPATYKREVAWMYDLDSMKSQVSMMRRSEFNASTVSKISQFRRITTSKSAHIEFRGLEKRGIFCEGEDSEGEMPSGFIDAFFRDPFFRCTRVSFDTGPIRSMSKGLSDYVCVGRKSLFPIYQFVTPPECDFGAVSLPRDICELISRMVTEDVRWIIFREQGYKVFRSREPIYIEVVYSGFSFGVPLAKDEFLAVATNRPGWPQFNARSFDYEGVEDDWDTSVCKGGYRTLDRLEGRITPIAEIDAITFPVNMLRTHTKNRYERSYLDYSYFLGRIVFALGYPHDAPSWPIVRSKKAKSWMFNFVCFTGRYPDASLSSVYEVGSYPFIGTRYDLRFVKFDRVNPLLSKWMESVETRDRSFAVAAHLPGCSYLIDCLNSRVYRLL